MDIKKLFSHADVLKTPIAGAVISAMITISALKTDIDWVKTTLKDHSARIWQLENKKGKDYGMVTR